VSIQPLEPQSARDSGPRDSSPLAVAPSLSALAYANRAAYWSTDDKAVRASLHVEFRALLSGGRVSK